VTRDRRRSRLARIAAQRLSHAAGLIERPGPAHYVRNNDPLLQEERILPSKTQCLIWVMSAIMSVGLAVAGTGAAAQAVMTFEEQFERNFREGSQGENWSSLSRGDAVPRNDHPAPETDRHAEDHGGHQLDQSRRSRIPVNDTRPLAEFANGIINEIRQQLGGGPSAPAERSRRGHIRIPPGHSPPPGACRVWFLDRPPGHQPPPGSCNVRVPRGAFLVRG
jgi:hypothetical protein